MLKTRNYLIVLILLMMVYFTGCSSKTKDRQEISDLILENARAAQEEDLEAYMATIHPGSPGYEETETEMKSLFDMYDIKYEISDIKFLELRKTGARVQWVQRVTKVNGPEFRNSRATVVHILSKHEDKWKMYSGEVKSITYLE